MIPVESIERVIDDLETVAQKLMSREDSFFFVGAIAGLDYAAQELRKVLSDRGKSKS